MRLPRMLSVVTINVLLAVFAIAMALVALGLLAFVLTRDSYPNKDSSKVVRDKLKRHESTVVDFKNPSTVPDHFLKLNTLMFQKRLAKNNQINNQVPPVPIGNFEMMQSTSSRQQSEEQDEEQFANRALPPIPGSEISSNQVAPVRARRSEIAMVQQRIQDMQKMETKPDDDKQGSHSPSSFVTDSGISDEDFSDGSSTTRSSTKPTTSSKSSSTTSEPLKSPKPQQPEESTIEPPAQKVIVDLECGNEFSLC